MSPRARPAGAFLTPAETTVLHLLANGRTMVDITAELRLACTTVDKYRRTALRKLDATDLPDAVQKAVTLGALRSEEIVTGPFAPLMRAEESRRSGSELRAARLRLQAVRSFADYLETEAAGENGTVNSRTVAAELRRLLGDTHARPVHRHL